MWVGAGLCTSALSQPQLRGISFGSGQGFQGPQPSVKIQGSRGSGRRWGWAPHPRSKDNGKKGRNTAQRWGHPNRTARGSPQASPESSLNGSVNLSQDGGLQVPAPGPLAEGTRVPRGLSSVLHKQPRAGPHHCLQGHGSYLPVPL